MANVASWAPSLKSHPSSAKGVPFPPTLTCKSSPSSLPPPQTLQPSLLCPEGCCMELTRQAWAELWVRSTLCRHTAGFWESQE